MAAEFWIIPLILLTAYIYSSVGHGGATGYLAIMSLFGIGIAEMRSSALILNLIVASIASFQFIRSGYFRFNLFFPFAAASIPFAYLGSLIKVDDRIYHLLLGFCLIAAAGWIAFRKDAAPTLLKSEQKPLQKVRISCSIIIGAIIGLISGIVGIGGGVLLSPIIYLLGWGNMKETAAVSALFILVNSAAGLAGTNINAGLQGNHIFIWIGTALIGGLLGSYSGSIKFNAAILKSILAVVLTIAGTKLFLF